MNLEALEFNFKYNSFINKIKSYYKEKERDISFIDYVYSLILNEGIFLCEIKDENLVYNESQLKILFNEECILDIIEFIKDYFFKIDTYQTRFSNILRKWFNKVDSNFILNNEKVFLTSLRFKHWNRLILEEYLKIKPELKQISNNSEEFNYFWLNICKYQNVDKDFIQKYIHIFLKKYEYCFLLRTRNNQLFYCNDTILRRIIKKSDKYFQRVTEEMK